MTNLPISSYKNEIIEAVNNHAFTIITAETGSGKSTQVPQYLLEYYDQIVVTEPRIMAAKTLACRVAEEMEVFVGQEVGYRTGYDKCSSYNSKILFCTDGLQLIRTIFDDNHQKENVLIIDEAHEWNLNIETLIAWCKHMRNTWKTKVVVMSATVDTTALAEFFEEDVAVLNIPGTLYDVTVEERDEYSTISTIIENVRANKNILVFVPGKKEIANTIKEIGNYNVDATVLPLHGEMDWEEQKKCFEEYDNPKVIVSTNVAQTSLTIPDIDVVVDTGEARISETHDGIQGLFLRDISRADILQRKGRAGRTKDGKYYLCSKTNLNERPEYTVPEIQRSILDRVVLQLLAIGLDAEELEFFHQPDKASILDAKKELTAIGAISGNNVTELGYKIAVIPVSVQFARMIVEAEKYGVTEQVMTIAAIIEMGGILGKEGRYSKFTTESSSDLLAEFDVWKAINKMGYIDFQELGINKKNFFRIKEHLKKLREALYGIVEMNSNDDRDAIVKSCLSGLVSHIYLRRFDCCYDIDRNSVQLDKHSCVPLYSASFLIGIPKTIEFKNRYGWTQSIDLVAFATKIDIDMLIELAPNSIETETILSYSKSEDAVEITIQKEFGGFVIDSEITYDACHPKYDELKAKYEEEHARYEESILSYCGQSYAGYTGYNYSVPERQETVVIDNKQYRVSYYEYDGKPSIVVDDETLFNTEVNDVFLDSGDRVYLTSFSIRGKMPNIKALKNAVELNRIRGIREGKKRDYERIKVTSLNDIITHKNLIGKIKLTMSNGGYGDEPIFAYGCITLKKNTVCFMLVDDEELASSNTLEALQYMVMKEIEKNYGESKFSHLPGKKKKVLTSAEMEKKKEFDSLVREVLQDINIDTVSETLEFLDEYYNELMLNLLLLK